MARGDWADEPGRPVSVKFYVRDLARSIRFYQVALGLRWNAEIRSFQIGEYPDDDFCYRSRSRPKMTGIRPAPGISVISWQISRRITSARSTPARRSGIRRTTTPARRAHRAVRTRNGNRIELWQA
jgi:hypothetical protein